MPTLKINGEENSCEARYEKPLLSPASAYAVHVINIPKPGYRLVARETGRVAKDASEYEWPAPVLQAVRHTETTEGADAVAAMIVHEVKQPLSAMVINADAGVRFLNCAQPDLDEAAAAFKQIAADGRRAADVIGSIRAIFKSDASRTRLDIKDLIGEALTLERAGLQNQQILVRTEADAQLPQITANRVQLLQLLLNLITNAIDSMAVEDGPRVLSIRSTVHGGSGVMVSVADTGPGVSSQDFSQIFNPLFTTKSDGMGMGLSICRSIIEAHGGQLWVSGNTPQGAMFQFVLPGSTSVHARFSARCDRALPN